MEYYYQNIAFPIKAEVDDWQEPDSIVHDVDKVNVHSIDGVYDLYGIIVNTRFGRKKVYLSLVDPKPIDLNKVQQAILDDYNVWFSNR